MGYETAIQIAGATIGAYLVGSINTTLVVSRCIGIRDIRSVGSGNPGATNLFRRAGPMIAVPVLIADVGKSAAAILLLGEWLPKDTAPLLAFPLLAGNIFPIFHKFRGGKGVATAVGIFLGISPTAMLMAGGIFIIVVLIIRRVSVGSLVMALAFMPAVWIVDGMYSMAIVAGMGIATILAITHRANWGRLIRGEEPKLTIRNKAPDK